MLYKALTSPKRSGVRREKDLYYYYAAFAQSFADQKILELDLPKGAVILDPWCGSGTTLASARRFGHSYFGCDINPVSVVLTKSRFASPEDANFVLTTFQKIIDEMVRCEKAKREPDSLLWMLRSRLFGVAGDCSWTTDRYRSIQPRTALLLAALFFFAREAMRGARSKNPSWRMKGAIPKLSITELYESFHRLKTALQVFEATAFASGYESDVAVFDNERESLASQPFADGVITSPPYLTRLDYGISTGVEWKLLHGDPEANLDSWRATFTGSVLTSRVPVSICPMPFSISRLLRQIHAHKSKAAQTYYFQFFRNYFVGIQNALVNITAACNHGAKGLFVVQDSQFKDLDVPLTDLFSDMLTQCGWTIEKKEAFSISPTFYRINSRRWAVRDFVRSENGIWAVRQ